MRAKFINESKRDGVTLLDYDRVNNAGKIEIMANEQIEDKFRMLDFEIPEERTGGDIMYKGKKAGSKYGGNLNFDPDFVMDNLALINNLISLTKCGFWYVNSRNPKFKEDPKSPFIISRNEDANSYDKTKKLSKIYKLDKKSRFLGGPNQDIRKFTNLYTGEVEEWDFYPQKWRRIPLDELKKYLTDLRGSLDNMIKQVDEG